MKTYITFGQSHVHAVNGKTFDKDCVAAIESNSEEEGREKAFEYFGDKFCFSYFGKTPDMRYFLRYFHRGVIEV